MSAHLAQREWRHTRNNLVQPHEPDTIPQVIRQRCNAEVELRERMLLVAQDVPHHLKGKSRIMVEQRCRVPFRSRCDYNRKHKKGKRKDLERKCADKKTHPEETSRLGSTRMEYV